MHEKVTKKDGKSNEKGLTFQSEKKAVVIHDQDAVDAWYSAIRDMIRLADQYKGSES